MSASGPDRRTEPSNRHAFTTAGIIVAMLLLFALFGFVFANSTGLLGAQGPDQGTATETPPKQPVEISVNATGADAYSNTTATVNISRAPTGLRSVNLSIRSSRPGSVRITGFTPDGRPSVTVVNRTDSMLTLRVTARNAPLPAGATDVRLGTLSLRTLEPGSVALRVSASPAHDANRSVVPTETRDGQLAVQQLVPRVVLRNQTVTFTNQTVNGARITVANATLPNTGYVAVFDAANPPPRGEPIAHTARLPPGRHERLNLTMSQPLFKDITLVAILYGDSGNGRWDGATHEPILRYEGSNVAARAALDREVLTTVDVVLVNASHGLQSFDLRVVAENALVADYQPHNINPDYASLKGGGVRANFVRLRGADLDNGIRPSKRNFTLFSVRFRSDQLLLQNELFLTRYSLQDENHKPIRRSPLRLRVRCGTPFAGPAPGIDADHRPRDPDCDGLFEDVNGDGVVSVSDARDLLFLNQSRMTREQITAFDFNGDGNVTIADSNRLRSRVS